ncbi:Fc.00g020910.m01.CDS01 [Cosmosporella sp. VM-42]
MAPVRRYLRISKYSVLECRIYLDNPSLAQSWLLNPRNPILPKVIESIRPLVLPKLREEKERSKKKSTKKKGIKDVVIHDDFEVSIFLTETSTRHSLLFKNKHFREKLPARMESNSTRLISETDDVPVDVDADGSEPVLREEDEDDVGLADIPLVNTIRRSKRQRQRSDQDDGFSLSEDDETGSPIEIDSDTEAPPHKRQRGRLGSDDEAQDGNDDKKKLAMDVSYDGFAIYGRVLCLVVKKRETSKGRQPGNAAAGSAGKPEGQAMMENWITSTQIPVGEEVS